jgi:hypothetical protein
MAAETGVADTVGTGLTEINCVAIDEQPDVVPVTV